MKFLKLEKGAFSFHISERERRALFKLLELYPLVPASYQKLSRDGGKPEDQQLLEDALNSQRNEHKAQVLAMLQTKSRFQSAPGGYQFNLKPTEAEWLLQVLNDIRVGSWLLLGSPDSMVKIFGALNDKSLPHFWSMEASGDFQMTLVHALTGGGGTPPPSTETGEAIM
ncbi:MAG TPA: hypothetical protein VN281_00475 [Verrucomicrobiae bacterium]|nr:hypothetical protein [Verrucomicrobiae bacterium]